MGYRRGECGVHEGVRCGVPVTPVDGLPHNGDQQVGHHAGVEGQVIGDHLEPGGGGEGRRWREGRKGKK